MKKNEKLSDKGTKNLTKTVNELLIESQDALTSFNVLFQYPESNRLKINDISDSETMSVFLSALQAIHRELSLMANNLDAYLDIYDNISYTPIAVNFINHLLDITEHKPLHKILERAALEILNYKLFFEKDPEDDATLFYVEHADTICRRSIILIKKYTDLLIKIAKIFPLHSLVPIHPPADKFFDTSRIFHFKQSKKLTRKQIDTLKAYAKATDRFSESRVFRYIDNNFFPTEIKDIRSIDRFFGYHSARHKIRRYFLSFVKENINNPLFISSLPGLGKTHMTIAYTLFFKELTLILPEPEHIEKPIEKLIRTLAKHRNRKFIIFFDDIDPRNVNWYYFRTNVGGSFALSPNITIILASNYEFPANIVSRGQSFTFPNFDEIRCKEMIEDYLKTYNIRKPNENLISIIAADYVEEFGQKFFDELSPRTLVRYLDRYEKDMNKRKRTLALSKEEFIPQPDPELFLDMNLKLMKALYGEKALERLQEEHIAKYL